jgi:hypothetical protein
MVGIWAPPPVKVDGKSLRLRDFVSWMLQAPVVSLKAKECLEPLISPFVEFLPLVELRGIAYFAMNVIQLVDCLNYGDSEILYSKSDPDRILRIKEYRFRSDRVRTVPVFKVPEVPSDVFVMQPFVDLIIRTRLTGAKFADPGVNPFRGIVKGESCNIIPGVMD